MTDKVVVNGQRYRPVDEERAREVADLLKGFTLEASRFWRDRFIEWDTEENGRRIGMYSEGDEECRFFSEAFLYNLVGKGEARTILGIIRELCDLAGVEYR